MPDTSPVLALPFIQPAQAQKHVTHNEAIERLDVIVQLRVRDFDINTPPASPAEGQTWALGTSPTGAWSGEAGRLASWRGGGWFFLSPREGWRAYGQTDGSLRIWNNTAWVTPVTAAPDLNNVAGLGVNSSYDATNKLSVAADATLLNHDGTGHQLKLNKSGAGDTASLLYQTGFSGRAEMGLAGNDDFALKVSADGSAWFTALSADSASGRVSFDQVMRLTPRAQPTGASAGEVYFDSTTAKLRCFDGTIWQDLF